MKAIAAMAKNRVIGAQGKIPWHLPEDFRWFKRATMGGVIVMGRKTYESLGKPLPGRENVVFSRTADIPGVRMVRSIEELLSISFGDRDVWIIGGSDLYAQTLPLCSDLYLSMVNLEPTGDALFPSFESDFEFCEVIESHAEFEVRHYKNSAQSSAAPRAPQR
jgi:dihydrofolate reductase